MKGSAVTTLLLVTATRQGESPSEDVFLRPELDLLRTRFGRVERMSLSERPPLWRRALMAFSPVALRAGIEALRSGESWRDAVSYAANAVCWRNRFRQMLRRGGIEARNTVVYTFWFDFATTGFALLGREAEGMRCVSRAHGYDVREVKSDWLRRLTLRRIDGLYAVSVYSRNVLSARWPGCVSKFFTAYLGSEPPSAVPVYADTDDDAAIVLVSCARIVGIKRIDRMAALVAEVARTAAPRRVEWVHFGGGDSRLQSAAVDIIENAGLPSDARPEVSWRGAVDNAEIRRFYSSSRVSWVMLTSDDEGLSIALCEAMSYGIPVVATAVGGVGELVADGVNGLLAPRQFAAADLARRMMSVMDTPEHYGAMRRAARRIWTERFDASRLRPSFIDNVLLKKQTSTSSNNS